MPENIEAARYHSLVVEKESLPACLEVSAVDGDGQIMGLCHREYPVFGIQFHPESFMTEHGIDIIKNFIAIKIK
jgi:anthranilate/para-aminobenzoate synthase component II